MVLGASEWSLEEADVAEFRRSALDLLTHFALSRARGSLFGFIDVSHGARSTEIRKILIWDQFRTNPFFVWYVCQVLYIGLDSERL